MEKMGELTELLRRILERHRDPVTGIPEAILLGFSNIETAGEHLSRYVLASNLVHGSVLDCASGTCYGSRILMRRGRVDRVVSVDIDAELLAYGKIVYQAECVLTDARSLPFRRNAFDSVVSLETLEHLRDSKGYLNNIRRCLKPSGTLILSTPNKLFHSPGLRSPPNPYHMREYYLGDLLDSIRSCGFEIEQAYGEIRVTWFEVARRILGSLLKFVVLRLGGRIVRIDVTYAMFLESLGKKGPGREFLDPDPSSFPLFVISGKHCRLLVPFQYLIILATAKKG